MKKKRTNILKKLNRESAKKQGFYDGRFATKVIPNKKKDKSRKRIKEELKNGIG